MGLFDTILFSKDDAKKYGLMCPAGHLLFDFQAKINCNMDRYIVKAGRLLHLLESTEHSPRCIYCEREQIIMVDEKRYTPARLEALIYEHCTACPKSKTEYKLHYFELNAMVFPLTVEPYKPYWVKESNDGKPE